MAPPPSGRRNKGTGPNSNSRLGVPTSTSTPTPRSGRSSPLRQNESRSPLYGLPGGSVSQQAGPSSIPLEQLSPHLLSAETHLGKMTLTAPDNMLRRQAQEKERQRKAKKAATSGVAAQGQGRKSGSRQLQNNSRVVEAGNASRVVEAGNASRVVEAGNASRVVEAGNASRVVEAGNASRVVEAGNASRVVEAGNASRVVEAGRSASPNRTIPASGSSPARLNTSTLAMPSSSSSSPSPTHTPATRRSPSPTSRASRNRSPSPRRRPAAGRPATATGQIPIATSTDISQSAATPATVARRAPHLASLRRHNIYDELADMGLSGMESGSDSDGPHAQPQPASQSSTNAAPPITEDDVPPPPFPEGSQRPETPPRAPPLAHTASQEEGWNSEDERRWNEYRSRVPDSPPPAFVSDNEDDNDNNNNDNNNNNNNHNTVDADNNNNDTTVHPDSDSEQSSSDESLSTRPVDEERQAWEEDTRRGLSFSDRIQRLELRRRRKEELGHSNHWRLEQVARREMDDWELRAVMESTNALADNQPQQQMDTNTITGQNIGAGEEQVGLTEQQQRHQVGTSADESNRSGQRVVTPADQDTRPLQPAGGPAGESTLPEQQVVPISTEQVTRPVSQIRTEADSAGRQVPSAAQQVAPQVTLQTSLIATRTSTQSPSRPDPSPAHPHQSGIRPSALPASGALSHPSLPRTQHTRTASASANSAAATTRRRAKANATVSSYRGKATSIRPRPSSESHSRFRDDASAAAERRRLAWGITAPVAGLNVPSAPSWKRTPSANAISDTELANLNAATSGTSDSSSRSRQTVPGAFFAKDDDDDDESDSASDDSAEAWAEEARQLQAMRRAAERSATSSAVVESDDDDSDHDDKDIPHTTSFSPNGQLQRTLPKAPPPLVLGRSRGGGLAYDASDSDTSSDENQQQHIGDSDSDQSLSPGEEEVVRHTNPRWQHLAPQSLEPASLARKSLDSARDANANVNLNGRSSVPSIDKGKQPVRPVSAGHTTTSHSNGSAPAVPVKSNPTSHPSAGGAGEFISDSASSASFSADEDEPPRSSTAAPAHRKTSSSSISLWSGRLPGEPSATSGSRAEVNDRLKSLFGAPLSSSSSSSVNTLGVGAASKSSDNLAFSGDGPRPRRRSSAKSLQSQAARPTGAETRTVSGRFNDNSGRTVIGARPGDEQQARKAALMDIARLQSALRSPSQGAQQGDSANSLAALERLLSASLRDTPQTPLPQPLARQNAINTRRPPPPPRPQSNSTSQQQPAPVRSLNATIPLGGGATVSRANSFINPRSSFVPLPTQTRLPAITDATRHFPPSRQPTVSGVSEERSQGGGGGVAGSRVSALMSRFEPAADSEAMNGIGATGGRRRPPPPPTPLQRQQRQEQQAHSEDSEAVNAPPLPTPLQRQQRQEQQAQSEAANVPPLKRQQQQQQRHEQPAHSEAVNAPPPPPRRQQPLPDTVNPPATQRQSLPDAVNPPATQRQPLPDAVSQRQPSPPLPPPHRRLPPALPVRPALPPRTQSRTELARQATLEALTRNASPPSAETTTAADRPVSALLERGPAPLPSTNTSSGRLRESRPLPQPPGPPGLVSSPLLNSGAETPTRAEDEPGNALFEDEDQDENDGSLSAHAQGPDSVESTTANDAGPASSATTGHPQRQDSIGITDLDILASRLELTGSHYEDINAITEFLGPATSTSLTPSEVSCIPLGLIEVEKRRVTKEGKIKMKLGCLGLRVDKCGICLGQFKESQRAYVLMRCLHCFHEECGRQWFRRSRKCSICRMDILEEEDTGDLIEL
ncbi:unnamed protein product [Sympodiomycopsis kandeliae]